MVILTLLCIAALVLPASASTVRTAPANLQPVVVNVSPQATQAVQPVTERIAVVTTAPIPQRTTLSPTVPTTVPATIPTQIPVVSRQASAAIAPVITTQPTRAPVVQAGGKAVTNAGPSTAGIADVKRVDTFSPSDLSRRDLTTTGVKNPVTGDVMSPGAHPGSGLPGGDIAMPSAEDQWNSRIGKSGLLGGGTDYIGQGTPFDDNPFSNPMDDFMKQHGGNLPDPLEAFGKGRSGFSPAEGEGEPSVSVREITVQDGSTSIICGSDYVGVESANQMGGDECIVVQFDGQGGFKIEADRKMAVDFVVLWVPHDSGDQQYEGEGGYTGGTGHSANDLDVGMAGRLSGKVTGGRDPGDPDLGKDTGGKMPAVIEAIGKYVTRGGRLHGKAGWQSGDSGQGQDIGGTAEGRVSGLKKALGAQRFIIDPNAQYAEQVPWWIEKVVSPTAMNGAAQAGAVQADAVQKGQAGAAAKQVT